MPGLIGRKLGMTSIFDEDRKMIGVTIVEAGPCVVTQLKTLAVDGYEAVQIGFDERKSKNVSQALIKHFEKAGLKEPCAITREFDYNPAQYKLGDKIGIEIIEPGVFVNVTGTTKGKGFQGVVKRHGFAGVGGQTHGQHNRLRAPGSMGACSFPSRVFKGKRLGGQTGHKTKTTLNLKVLKVDIEKNLVYLQGSVPGPAGSFVSIKL